MSELTFQAKGHKYFLDGEEIPSVSEITRFMSREVYGEIDPIALERAAERGTAIHKLTEQLDKNGYVSVPSEYAGYIDAYMRFRKEHDVKWGHIEHMVHTEAEYAGTVDRVGFIDGKIALVDFKTNKTISPKHQLVYTAALNLYRMALEDEGIVVEKLYILHLKPNGNYKLIQLPIDFGLGYACLTLHRAFAAAKKKKAKPVENSDN